MTHPYRCLATVDTPKPLARWRSWLNRWWLDYAFSRFQWWRRMRGGHWEQWFIDWPVGDDVWLQSDHGTRPGLGVALTAACEEWS